MREGSRIEEDEVLSDRNRTLCPLFIPNRFLLYRFSGGSRCFEERPCASGSTSVVSPFVRRRSGIGICSPACSVVTDRVLCCYLSFVNIHLFMSLCLCVHSRLLCRQGCVPVLLCSFITGSLSFLFPLSSPALRFKSPVVPPRFSTHALL